MLRTGYGFILLVVNIIVNCDMLKDKSLDMVFPLHMFGCFILVAIISLREMKLCKVQL